MGLKEQLQKMFPKAKAAELKTVLDAAAKIKTDDEGMEVISDEAPAWADALMKSCKDVMTSISNMSQPSESADEGEEDPKKKPVEKKSDDADGGDMEGRLAKLEAMVAKLCASKDDAEEVDDEDKVDDEAEETDDEESEETGDEDADDADEEGEESDMVGDEKSKVEILAPGLKVKGKDFKVQALKAAYKTKDGKETIEKLTGGRPLDFKKTHFVNVVFDAAAEMLKVKRSKSFSKTRQGATVKDGHSDNTGAAITPEKLNEINQKHYAAQQGRH